MKRRFSYIRDSAALARVPWQFCAFNVLLCFALPLPSVAQDFTMLGGDTTSFLPDEAAIQVASPNLTDPVRRDKQLAGFSVFHGTAKKNSGLGPFFVNTGCAKCHVQNGKGPVRINPKQKKPTAMVIKTSLEGLQENGAPIDVPGIGEQVQDRTTKGGINRRRNRRLRKLPHLKWKMIRGEYPDGTKYTLREPRLLLRIRGYKKSEILTSLRMSPGLVGMGLIEAIPEEQILDWSDPEDTNGDGISGRPQYVPSKRNGGLELGRFGFRASHPTLEQQSAAAAFFDIGLTNPLFTDDPEAEPEISEENLEILTIYQAIAGVPAARNQDDFSVLRGKELFQELGCDDCHKMTVVSSDPNNPELDGQTIHPFTDMLLHDMGPELADERAEFSASGSEWRTAPLWGLGHLPKVSKQKQRYMHDGRARSFEEAILWHGGEAENAKTLFTELSKGDRTALVRFLKSL